jgi:hypothetical protein
VGRRRRCRNLQLLTGEIVSIDDDGFADRQRVSYRFHGDNADGPFVVEQQVYYTESNGQINYMRVLCSGFRPR